MPFLVNPFPRPPLVWIDSQDKDGNILQGRPTPAFLEYMSKQAQQLTTLSNAGNPTAIGLVPTFVGQFYVDTTGADLYWASSATAAGWKKLTP